MRRPSSGIALILAAAMAALLATLTAFFLHAGRQIARSAQTGLKSMLGDMAAESGMEYAAARLSADSVPRPSATAVGRGDDWTFRDGIGERLSGALNPSYSHGEWWDEAAAPGTGEGAFDTADDLANSADLDGNGRFSAWSGRVRGPASSPFGLTFSLKIEAPEGRIPLNAGFLDALDRPAGGTANGVPDCRDLAFFYHRGLTHALNNLGALTLPAGHVRRWLLQSPSNPYEPVDYSLLGEDLLLARPVGGYRNVAHVAQRLEPLGYAPDDFSGLLPYLDFSLPDASPQNGFPWTDAPTDILTHIPAARVNLRTAAPVVLESLWRYVTCSRAFSDPFWDVPGRAALNPRANNPFGPPLPPPWNRYLFSQFILFPDEARRLAAKAIACRDSTPAETLSWGGLYRHLLDEAESATLLSYSGSGPGPDPPSDGKIFMSSIAPGLSPRSRARYAQAKTDLAFTVVCPEGSPFPHAAPFAWSGWGIQRPGDPLPLSISLIQPMTIHAISLPPPPSPPSPAHDPGQAYGPALSDNPFLRTPYLDHPAGRLFPLGLSLAIPSRFSVSAIGTCRVQRLPDVASSRSGSLCLREAIDLTSQEDFENRDGAPELSRYGLQVTGRGTRLFETDPVTGDDYPSTVTLPFWPREAYPAGIAPDPAGYPRSVGALALAPRQAGLQGAALYWRFADNDPGNPEEFRSEGLSANRWEGEEPFSSGLFRPLDPNHGQADPLTLSQFNPFCVSGFKPPAAGESQYLLLSSRAIPPTSCPGIPDNAPIESLSIEAWVHAACNVAGLSHDTRLMLAPLRDTPTVISFPFANQMDLTLGSASGPQGPRDTLRFDIRSWPTDAGGGVGSLVDPLEIVLDHGLSASGIHHVVVTLRRETGGTRVTLIVDGGDDPNEIDSTVFPGDLYGRVDEMIHAWMIDELRIYDRDPPLSQTEALARYDLGRFVKRGGYRSPLYAPGPCSLREIQITGIVPAPLSTAGIEPFGLRIETFADRAGTLPLDTLNLIGLPSGHRRTLALPPCHSFRFTLVIDASAYPGPLLDTPVLESIRLTYRRQGSSLWRDWIS